MLQQLNEAYDILELEQSFCHALSLSDIAQKVKAPEGDPRVDWLFRWLLRRFNVDVLHVESPVLYSEAWHLLRKLLVSTPSSAAAQHLKSAQFLTILSLTLHWILEPSTARSTHDDAPPAKRRKKSSGRSVSAEPKAADPSLLPSISAFIEELRLKSASDSENQHGAYAAEFLKSVIRTTSTESANLLSVTLKIVLKSELLKTDLNLLFKVSVVPMCWIWRSAHDVGGQSTEQADLAFSSSCTLPALTLLSKFPVGESADLRWELEDLLAVHCISPAREVFRAHRTPKDREPETMRKLLSGYLETLDLIETPNQETSDGNKSGDPRFYNPLACFFSLAERAFIRDTHEQRQREQPWLHSLFYSCICDWSKSPPSDGAREVTRQLLYICKGNRIMLSDDTLDLVCHKLAGLSDSIDSTVDWRMIGQCMDVQPDLMVLRIGNCTKTTNETLRALHSVVFSAEFGLRSENAELDRSQLDHESCQSYEDALRCVVLPMIRIQAQNRNMSSFLRVWGTELAGHSTAIAVAQKSYRTRRFSIWEDERVGKAVIDVLRDSITESQLTQEVDRSCGLLKGIDVHPDSLSVPQIAKVNAVCVVGSAILKSVTKSSTVDLLEHSIERVHDSLPDLLGAFQQSPNERYHLWQLASSIDLHWPHLSSQRGKRRKKHVKTLVKHAVKTLAPAIGDPKASNCSPANFLAAFSAFEYLQTHVREDTDDSGKKIDLFREEWCKVLASPGLNVGSSGSRDGLDSGDDDMDDDTMSDNHVLKARWVGHDDEITKSYMFQLACSVSIISNLRSLDCLSRVELAGFIRRIYEAALVELTYKALEEAEGRTIPDDGPNVVTYVVLWSRLLESTILDKSHETAHVLNEVIAQYFSDFRWSARKASLNLRVAYRFAISNVRHILTTQLSREDHGKIEDSLMYQILNCPSPTVTEQLTPLVLLTRLVTNSPFGMTRLKDPGDLLWAMVRKLEKATPAEVKLLMPAMREFVEITTPGGYETAQDTSIWDGYATKFLQRLEPMAPNSKHNIFMLVSWGCVVLERIYDRADEVLNIYRDDEKLVIRHLFQVLVANVSEKRSAFALHALNAQSMLLDGMILLKAYWGCRPEGATVKVPTKKTKPHSLHRKQMRLILREVHDNLLKKEELLAQASLDLHEELFKVELMQHFHLGDVASLLNVASSVLKLELLKAIELLDLHVQPSYLCLKSDDKARFLLGLTAGHEWSSHESTVHLICTALSQKYAGDEQTEKMNEVVPWLVHEMIQLVRTTGSPSLCSGAIAAIDAALKDNPWAINQKHIDEILGLVTVMTSKSSMTLPASAGFEVYHGLCNLFGSILANHRIRTGGRSHLLIDAYQGLLACLFVPYANHSIHAGSGRPNSIQQPSWMSPAVHPPTPALAERWTRLMTSLCDPSSFAVRRSKSSGQDHDLNDETKKAKKKAGEFMQYVLEAYCAYSLRGRLNSEVRDALLPGLFSILEAMGKRIRAKLNETLSVEGRSVFRSLCAEWDQGRGGGE